MKLLIFTDGGSRGNPGPSALGVYVTDARGKLVLEHGRYLGVTTNNIAEWTAVLDALEHAKKLGATEVEMKLDSELVVHQWSGKYRVKNAGLLPIYLHARRIGETFKKVTLSHVRREFNKEADRLVNETIDRHLARK